LITEIGNAFHEIVEIEQAAEHYKRICKILLQRVHTANLVALDLKVQRNQELYNKKNFLGVQFLVNVIVPIKRFASEISQMKTLIKYMKTNSIMKTYNELCLNFDECIKLLKFTGNKICKKDVIEDFKADQDDLNKVS
jgi:hypothetical protein